MGRNLIMKKYFLYLKALLRHKWFVFLEACKLGIPFLGIVHDISKFLPDEFIPYARFFYGEYEGLKKEVVKEDFDRAWLKHLHRNKHHWQRWLLINDNGIVIQYPEKTFKQVEPQNIPPRYLSEMIADWRGAGRAYGNPDTKRWYLKNRNNIILHPVSQILVEFELQIDDGLWTEFIDAYEKVGQAASDFGKTPTDNT
jgi:hypothetical protein